MVVAVSSFVLLPASAAYAGILYFVGEMFSAMSFSQGALEAPVNSQTMDLLEAVRNYDPSPDDESGGARIVDDSALAASTAPQPEDISSHSLSGDQISVYVVRKGDTLSQIAKMFGVSINTILWSNDIPHGGNIAVGQKLVILPVSGVQYTIKKGDTVAKLALLYHADADEIRSFNGVEEGEKLVVGDTLIIPNGVESEALLVSPIKTIKKALGSLVDNSPSIATDGYFVRPTAGKKTQGIHGHNGIDFHASKGTTIVAAAGGIVVVSRDSGWNGGYGQYIVIKHSNGTQTLYAHLSSNIVSEGQEVSQGQLIALSGDTGKSFGPHLHFEVRGGRNPF